MANDLRAGNGTQTDVSENASDKARAVLEALGMPKARIQKCKSKRDLSGEYCAWCASLPRRD